MTGRKPIPTEIKRLNGNPGKRPLNDREPKPRQRRPKPPAHLSAEALTEWRRVLRILAPMGVITEAETDVLAVYAQAYARWAEASAALAASGLVILNDKGVPMINPYLRIVETAADVMRRLMAELGMTPSARVRLVAPDSDSDPLDSFLQGLK